MKRGCIVVFFLVAAAGVRAQEFNCTVQVLAPQITDADKKIFETLQTSIYEFINNRKWTNDVYQNQERIECSIIITVNERVSNDEFRATLQVQLRRPVYKSSYYSPVLNHNDENFQFRYVEFQPLDFSEQTHMTNLTSVLAFYAYLILGIDYDTFSAESGTMYYQKAMAVVNNAQNAQEKGWKAFEGTRNRYWLVESFLNPIFKPLRMCLYRYHRNGFDVMTDNVAGGRKEVLESLEGMKKIHYEKPGSFLMQVFFYTKADEIVNLFQQANPDEKAKITNLLNEIDPGNSAKYQNIMKNN